MAFLTSPSVQETSTSTGTGDVTLAGAVTGFRTFASIPGIIIGDTFAYSIEAVDASGVPTGTFENGTGTYSAANTLTRTTVKASSNAGAAVNFAAGSKRVSLTFDPANAVTLGHAIAFSRRPMQ